MRGRGGYAMERFWERRWFTRTLGFVGLALMLGTTCTGIYNQDDREHRRGDYLAQVAFSPDSTVLYGLIPHDVPHEDRVDVAAWSVATGKLLWRTKTPMPSYYGYDIAASKTVVAVGVGDETRFFSAKDGYRLPRLDQPDCWQPLAFTRDGRFLLGAPSSGIVVFDLQTGRVCRKLDVRNHNDNSNVPLSILPDSMVLMEELRGDQENLVAVDPKTDKTVRMVARNTLGGIWALSADGKRLALCRKGSVSLLDTQSGRTLAERKQIGLDTPRFLPDGRRVFLMGSQQVWNPKKNVLTGSPLVWNPKQSVLRPADAPEIFLGKTDAPDGTVYATTEEVGHQGRRLPLGSLYHTGKQEPYAALEGLTGW